MIGTYRADISALNMTKMPRYPMEVRRFVFET